MPDTHSVTAQLAGDDAIRDLFRAWLEQMAEPPPDVSDPDLSDEISEARIDRLCEIEDRIWAAPSAGAVGMAIKAFLVVRFERGGDSSGVPGGICGFDKTDYSERDGHLYEGQRWSRDLMIEAARFVPELAPLVAPIAEAPVSLGEMRAEADVEPEAKEPSGAAEAATELPFVVIREDAGLPPPVGRQFPRCFWHVSPTGDYCGDLEIGADLARRYLNRPDRGAAIMALQHIVSDMPRDLTGVEIGFLRLIGLVADVCMRVVPDIVDRIEQRETALLSAYAAAAANTAARGRPGPAVAPSCQDADALRRECEAIAARYQAPLPAGDAGLVQAVRRWRDLKPLLCFGRRGFHVTIKIEDAIVRPIAYDAADALEKSIEQWPAQGLLGAAAKLRYAIAAERDLEDVGLEQLLQVIEREAGASVFNTDDPPAMAAE